MKNLIITIITLFLLQSCGPSACECWDPLATEINSGFKASISITLSKGETAAAEHGKLVNDCKDKFAPSKNPHTGTSKSELVSHFKFRENQIRKAYNEVTKLCEE